MESSHELHVTYARRRVRATCTCGWSARPARTLEQIGARWFAHVPEPNVRTHPVPRQLARKRDERLLLSYDDLCTAYEPLAHERRAAGGVRELEAIAESRAYRAVPYLSVYLHTDHWYWTSLRAKTDADFTCQNVDCRAAFDISLHGSYLRCFPRGHETRFLDTHHLPEAVVGAEAPSDLLVLCRRCHDLLHTGTAKVPATRGGHVPHGAVATPEMPSPR